MPENTEQLILQAAKDTFLQKGYAGARMQEIADAAGINKAMLHYYYRKKDKLFLVVFDAAVQELVTGLSGAIQEEGTVMEKIEKAVRVYISKLQENPQLPLFIIHEISQNRLEFLTHFKSKLNGLPKFQQFFLQVMQEQAAGTIRAIPPMHLLLNVVSMSVFPFIVKPVFSNLMGIPESQYEGLILKDRADVVVDFIRHALEP